MLLRPPFGWPKEWVETFSGHRSRWAGPHQMIHGSDRGAPAVADLIEGDPLDMAVRCHGFATCTGDSYWITKSEQVVAGWLGLFPRTSHHDECVVLSHESLQVCLRLVGGDPGIGDDLDTGRRRPLFTRNSDAFAEHQKNSLRDNTVRWIHFISSLE